ncbi:MAG: hypothetical protein ACREV6_06850 [Clostridium sp.]|uniref:hypothetical protein n=1 Tax=Clostridium sp. TaxID=1506 RepID=UPI003D6D980A
MKKNTAKYIYFILGIVFAVTSIIYFSNDKKSFGICYISLTIIFSSLGFRQKNKGK